MDRLQEILAAEFVEVARLRDHVGAGQFGRRMGGADRHGAHVRAARRFDAEWGVLEHDALLRVHAQAPGGFEEEGRVGLAGEALVAADDDIGRCRELQAFEREGDVVAVAGRRHGDLHCPVTRPGAESLEAGDFAKHRAEQLAIDRFLLADQFEAARFVRVLPEQFADAFDAVAAGGAAQDFVDRHREAVAPGEFAPAARVERHGVDHRAVHVEDECADSFVIPAEAGTQSVGTLEDLGPRLRGDDGLHPHTPCFKLASMNASRSPSSTFCVFEISTPVRRSLMRLWSST